MIKGCMMCIIFLQSYKIQFKTPTEETFYFTKTMFKTSLNSHNYWDILQRNFDNPATCVIMILQNCVLRTVVSLPDPVLRMFIKWLRTDHFNNIPFLSDNCLVQFIPRNNSFTRLIQVYEI